MRLIFAIFAGLMVCCHSNAMPELAFQSTVYDLGIVYQYGYAEGRFIFQNTGDADLLLTAEPDCSCTTARIKSELVKPGEKGELSFKLHLAELYGISEKTIHVLSNARFNSNVVLTVKVDTKPLFRVTPEKVVIEQAPDVTTNIIFKIEKADHQKIKLTKLVTTDSDIDAHINDQLDPAGNSAEIWVEVKGTKPGPFQGAISVYESDTTLPDFFIRLSGQILPYVSIEPKSLFWGISEFDKSKPAGPRTIIVRCNRIQDEVHVSRLKSSLDSLQLSIKPNVEGKEYEITIKMAGQPKVSSKGTISIELDKPRPEIISIPILIQLLNKS